MILTSKKILVFAILIGSSFGFVASSPCEEPAPAVKEDELGETPNVHRCGNLFLAGQPRRSDFEAMRRKGIKHVISVRMPGELTWDAKSVLAKEGFRFSAVPIQGPDSLTDEVFDKVRKCLRESKGDCTLLHCGSATRVSAVWYAYRVLDQGVDPEQALSEAKGVSKQFKVFESKALDYVQRMQSQ